MNISKICRETPRLSLLETPSKFSVQFPGPLKNLENMITVFKNSAASGHLVDIYRKGKKEVRRECEVNAGPVCFFSWSVPIWKKRWARQEEKRRGGTVESGQRQEYLTASVEYSQTREPATCTWPWLWCA